MAQPRQTNILKAALGVFAVYLLIVIARAGYETGQVLAGKVTVADAFARFDVSGAALVLCGFVLFVALRKSPSK